MKTKTTTGITLLICGTLCLGEPLFAFAEKQETTTNALPEGKERHILPCDTLRILSPEGTTPRLPYLIRVTYSDGTNGFRQVKWSNAALTTEQEQADPKRYPAGKEYTVKGFIIGDNTTPEGYPVEARVKVTKETYSAPSHKPVANPLPLDKVTIDGDNRLTNNRDLATRTILSWNVSQQLYNYRDTYGLPTEGYTPSDGWDSPTTKLKGHGSGHYMSALAFAFAGATDSVQKNALRKNITRMVNELRECQERTFVWNDSLGRYFEARDFAPEEELREMKGTWEAFDQHKKEFEKYGYGYLNAIPAHHPALIEMYRAYNNEQWVWAPYYSIHKQLAGLIDIATYIDDKQTAEKALLIAKDMGLWIWNRLHYRTFVDADGTQEERRKQPGNRYEMWNMYIAGEDGGTGESLARLSEMTTDKQEKKRLLEAAAFFDSPAFYEPLSKNIDDIRTRHANQHIPKITSALRSFRGNKNPYYYNLALNFWNMVQGRYAYATGGVGNGEMFRQPYTQILSMNTNVTSDRNRNQIPNPTLNETCCAYNLAKLTKDLNCFDPDNAQYMDYYERVLYNQIVGSIHPTTYMTTYHYAVGLNASKPWGNHTPQASCCGGTGSENHVKYQEAIYFVSDKTIWVALYIPSTAIWTEKGVRIKQDCAWPAEKSAIRIEEGKGKFAMKLRIPYWATQGVEIKLNGKTIAANYQPSSYAEIPTRRWKTGDVVEINLPFTKHIHFGPDKMETAATGPNQTSTSFEPMWTGTLMYGPLAMATTGIENWKEATIDMDNALDSIKLNGPQKGAGANANLYTLNIGERLFVPDYYLGENSTHYLRINFATKSKMEENDKPIGIDRSKLNEAIEIALKRIKEQEEWNKLSVKVPEHSPWAPNGYTRMTLELKKAQAIHALTDEKCTQTDINSSAAALNAAINTMRPGNLPELEDLDNLLKLLNEARKKAAVYPIVPLTEAIEYAEMVVKYVGDGSGTSDMIERAEENLKKALEKAK